METREEVAARLLVKDDGSLAQDGNGSGGKVGRNGEKWSDSEHIFGVELLGIADGLNMAGERERNQR